MVKGQTLYVKIYDAVAMAVKTSISIHGRGLCISDHSETAHSCMMGQDGAWQENLSPRPNGRGPLVGVGGKPSRPYRPLRRLSN
jgi:hypothetical protein